MTVGSNENRYLDRISWFKFYLIRNNPINNGQVKIHIFMNPSCLPLFSNTPMSHIFFKQFLLSRFPTPVASAKRAFLQHMFSCMWLVSTISPVILTASAQDTFCMDNLKYLARYALFDYLKYSEISSYQHDQEHNWWTKSSWWYGTNWTSISIITNRWIYKHGWCITSSWWE